MYCGNSILCNIYLISRLLRNIMLMTSPGALKEMSVEDLQVISSLRCLSILITNLRHWALKSNVGNSTKIAEKTVLNLLVT